MNPYLKETITNEPFNMEWAAPISRINFIANKTVLAIRKTREKFRNESNELICLKTTTEYYDTYPKRKLHMNVIHIQVPSLYWGIREQTKNAVNFVYHVENRRIFNIFYDIWECDDTGKLNQGIINKHIKDNYELFNYYESQKDEDIIRKIKTLELFKNQHRVNPGTDGGIPYDVLCESIVILKQKHIKGFKPSFKDYVHLI